MKYRFPRIRHASLMVLVMLLFACEPKDEGVQVKLKNPLSENWEAATIELGAGDFSSLLENYTYDQLIVIDPTNESQILSQWIDYDGDGEMDELIFQIDLTSDEEKIISIRPAVEANSMELPEQRTYSRFVPERTDDYTWENDLVAFRTYGPEAQRRIEQNEYGGTLSSGIDAWLKKVNYPIIDKWYKENELEEGAYHIDRGEGYDPYHVGSSRGIGGTGIWAGDSLYISRNFISYRKIAEGPIRTVFELVYAPWEVDDVNVSETKLISLDLGSHLSKFKSVFTTEGKNLSKAVGITLHNKEGDVNLKPDQGVFRYWEKIDDHFLGTGIVMSTNQISEAIDHRVEYADGSQILVLTEGSEEEISYYAGFGWTEGGIFEDVATWDDYLNQFARKIQNPVIVEIL